MKSVLITPDFPPDTGGIQSYLYNLFLRNPHCDVIAPKNSKPEIPYPSNLFRIRNLNKQFKSKFNYFELIIKNLYLIRKEKYNFIHCGHVFPIGLIGYYAKKMFGTPYVVYTYAMEVKQLYMQEGKVKNLYLKVLNNANKIITISYYTKKILESIGVPSEKIIIIPPGVSLAEFSPGLKNENIIKKFGLDGKFTLLTVSRLVERKGHDKVIESIIQLKSQLKNIVYLIVGQGPNEEYLRKLVKDNHLGDYVKFVGFIPDDELIDYYRTCDIFIMLSREIEEQGDVEGYGIVFTEANACEKPVIGGFSGGVGDAIIDGVTGLLVDPTDIKEISKSIKTLYINKEKRESMGRAGREIAERKLNWDIISKMIRKIEEL